MFRSRPADSLTNRALPLQEDSRRHADPASASNRPSWRAAAVGERSSGSRLGPAAGRASSNAIVCQLAAAGGLRRTGTTNPGDGVSVAAARLPGPAENHRQPTGATALVAWHRRRDNRFGALMVFQSLTIGLDAVGVALGRQVSVDPYSGAMRRTNCGSQTRSWMTLSSRGAVVRRYFSSSGVAFASTQGTARRMWR
jgi:hypothetical protein